LNSAHFDKILEEKTKECYHEIYDEHKCHDIEKAKELCTKIIKQLWETDLSDEDRILVVKNALRSTIYGTIESMLEEKIYDATEEMRQEMR